MHSVIVIIPNDPIPKVIKRANHLGSKDIIGWSGVSYAIPEFRQSLPRVFQSIALSRRDGIHFVYRNDVI